MFQEAFEYQRLEEIKFRRLALAHDRTRLKTPFEFRDVNRVVADGGQPVVTVDMNSTAGLPPASLKHEDQ